MAGAAISYRQVGPSSWQSVDQHLLALTGAHGRAGAVGQSRAGAPEPLCRNAVGLEMGQQGGGGGRGSMS